MSESPTEYLVGALTRVLSLHMGTALDPEAEALTEHAAEDVLHDLSRPHRLGGLVHWLVDTAGVSSIVRALVDAVGPGNLVAAMVAEGVLERHTDDRGLPASDLDGTLVWQKNADDAYPWAPIHLFRLADQEADRG